MKFQLPEELPTGLADLTELRTSALGAFETIKTEIAAGAVPDDEGLEYLEFLVGAIETIDAAAGVAQLAEDERNDKIAGLLAKVGGEAATDEDDEDAGEDGGEADPDAGADPAAAAEVIAEAEGATKDAAGTDVVVASTGARRPVSYRGLSKGKAPDIARRKETGDFGFTMDPQAPGYKPGYVGFRELAQGLDSVRSGNRVRSNRPNTGQFAGLTLGRLARTLNEIEDSHELVREIERATGVDQWRRPEFAMDGSLTAAGGWCAPSETLYTFCDVPAATDLVSLPEITIRRGGVRWPDEPDMSSIFDSFEWFFTESQLEAVDGEGNPTAIKSCVDIPCVDTFTEIRLSAVGYCVEAGILQTQGWPELIEKFMAELTQEHFRALSRRTINDMVSGSTALAMPGNTLIGTASAVLNSIALMAVNLRLDRGLGRTALIEGVAPSWLYEVIRADLAMMAGVDTKAVTDAQIGSWFSVRNITMQFVGDWQTRDAGQPGNITTMTWPNLVNVLLYPAGAWFRALSNVIELGVMYPKEQLQVNRYTRMFTEDAIAVARRCYKSLNVQIPICPSGAIGARETVVCNSITAVNEVQSLATASGTITAGTFTLMFEGQTTTALAWNASASTIITALNALSTVAPGDIVGTGGALPGTPVVLTFGGAYAGVNVPAIVVDSTGLTGGTLAVSTTTQGRS
jgi:hypothetical protein